MASTYSTNLALELIGTGDQAGTWGNTTNTNLGTLIEQAVSGYVTQAMTTGNTTTITIPNGATGVARNMYIEMTGTGGANTFLVVPANKKLYFIYNNTTGAVTVKVSGQTGVSISAGEKQILVSNGTDVVLATTLAAGSSANITNLTGTTLAYTSGTITNISDGLGPIRNIPQSSSKVSPYTLQSTDNGTYILATSGTITVPNSTFSAGNAVSIYNNSANTISLTLSTSTSYLAGTNLSVSGVSLSTRGICTVLFISPTECVISGNIF